MHDSQTCCQAKNAALCIHRPVSFTMGKSKAKQRCVMGVGMCLYAHLVQTKNMQSFFYNFLMAFVRLLLNSSLSFKSAIILQCYHPHLSDFYSRPRLTQPYNILVLPKFI